MATVTSRPFAYNTGSTIEGTIQVGSLAVGTPVNGFSETKLIWWNGPDEGLGYVIANSVPNNNQPTPIQNVKASVGFFRTNGLSEQSFAALASKILNMDLRNGNDASYQLTINGFWNSWVITYVAGLYKMTYSGYFNDNVNFFATATPQTFGTNPATSVQTTAISEASSNDGSYFSCQWLGYFKPTTTETYTFYTSSDDASYAWVGATAISGFTTANAVVNNGGAHGNQERFGTIELTSGVYYPIRIQFGEAGGGDVLTFNYSTPTITKTTNVTGLIFYNNTTNGF
jgi:hypothetical protein